MKKDYAEEFWEDLQEFKEMTAKFYRKEITVPEYKSFSGGFGSYAQRGGERSMLRLRLTGGEIRKEQVKFIADSIAEYSIDLVHLTTCQTVQLHNLTQAAVCELIEKAWKNGIITRGGGGDFPRNVMCSPLSGVDSKEAFDVLPYAREAADYLLGFIKKVKLPRKLKVCFSNNENNVTHATFRDLGFVAKRNGKFDVYAAGGLGNKPKFGVLVAEDIEPGKVLYCVKTMVDVFTQYGNYEQRAASRSRFLQETLGVEGLQKVFADTLAENMAQEKLDIEAEPDQEAANKATGITVQAEEEKALLESGRVICQKQQGLYAVSYYPVGGLIPVSFWGRLYEAIRDMEAVRVRLTPDQGMYLINLTAKEAQKILAMTADGASTQFERSTACIGADICQVGIGKSQVLLQACVERVRKEHFADGVLPAIHISGCPSSCSAHQTTLIGLRGGMKQTSEGPKPAFAVYDNGCERQGKERMGDELGVITVDSLPEFFVELGHAVADKGLTYEVYRKQYQEEMTQIVAKYV